MAQVRMTVTELKSIESYLDQISDRVDDWSDLADELETIIREDYKLKFESSPATEVGGTIWGGQYWRPLEEGYLTARPERRSGVIAIDTENLMKAYTRKDYYGSFTDVSEDEMTFGVDADLVTYAEEVEAKFPISFWHPILLEKVTRTIADWYLKKGGTQ